jgi:hypothetical protein
MRILTEKEKESQFKAKAKPLTSHSNPTGIIAERVEKMCSLWKHAGVISGQIDLAKLRPPGGDGRNEL